MLRTIFWVITAVIIVVFVILNPEIMTVRIFPDYGSQPATVLAAPKSALILGVYALGAIPVWLVYRASRWNMTRRIENAERQLADLRQQNSLATQTASTPASNDGLASDPLPATVTPNTPSL
ncbi:LapA family protein [Pseudonocardia sp. TMWB2A]|uniref:LapA family protein n=1 Tax=Pseudonocardia sp. TMWB2A TaxID=687430 RepID=UPI00307D956E